jgi:hypothetical protein
MNPQQIMRLAFVAVYTKLTHADTTIMSHALDADFDLKNMVDAHNILENARTALAREFIAAEMRLSRKS